MESDCSFVSIVRGHCGHDRRDRNKAMGCIPLLSCQRDINGHKAMFAFHGIVDEIELILARASIFSSPRNIDQMTICPAHRASLGTGWTCRVPDKCRILSILSGHSKDVSKKPKADTDLSKAGSQTVLQQSGIFLPVGSGLCPFCNSIK